MTRWGDKVFREVTKLKRDPEELPSFKMAAVSVDHAEGEAETGAMPLQANEQTPHIARKPPEAGTGTGTGAEQIFPHSPTEALHWAVGRSAGQGF